MHESRLFQAITRQPSIDLHLVNVQMILDGYPSLYQVGDLLTDVRSVRNRGTVVIHGKSDSYLWEYILGSQD